MTHTHPKNLRLEHLWLLIAVMLIASFGALFPIDTIDFWWHLALGRDISRLGYVPTTSSHSWVLPQTQVAADGRIELYPYEHWLRYLRIVKDEDALRELDQLGATHAMLNQRQQPELIRRLQAPDSGWMRIYSDEQTIIFERRSLTG